MNPIDLAINKLLALVGRDEPRDYLDIHEAMRVLPLGALCWAAAGKDPGFTPSMLLDLLRRRGKLPVARLMSGRLKLEEINVGFDRLHEGKAVRQVVVF